MAVTSRKKQRACIFTTIILSLVAVAVLATAIGTENWITSKPERIEITSPNTTSTNGNATGDPPVEKEKGAMRLGLFRAVGTLTRSPLQPKHVQLNITCGSGYCIYEYEENDLNGALKAMEDKGVNPQEVGLFSRGLFVSLMIFASLALILGMVSAIFGLINVVTKPIETINGPLGLFIWNGLGFTFSLTTTLMYVWLFEKYLSVNYLPEKIINYEYYTADETWLDWSFYLTIVPVVCFLINILLVFLSGINFQPMLRRREDISSNNPDMILY
ncbi:PREDICTED: clarin-3-like isoform X1 [Priapulus caudatus]|uniref:Clarin-3-like isoform X1 n=1 Tax=Priapulus caudatus TaxID=37621 RepID=A0ABM1EMW8_PRICU|nr:PREDICTED: clarin-3-like isoform X1 [Priapulus caudatus]